MTKIMPNYKHLATPELKRRLSDLQVLSSSQATTLLIPVESSHSNRLQFGFKDDLDAYRDSLYGNCTASVEYYDNQSECWILLVNFGRPA